MTSSLLWDEYSTAAEYSASIRKLVQDTHNFFKEKSELDRTYAQGLQQLSKCALLNSVHVPVGPMRDLLTTQAHSLLTFSSRMCGKLQQVLWQLTLMQDCCLHMHRTKAKALNYKRERVKRTLQKAKRMFQRSSSSCRSMLWTPSPDSSLQQYLKHIGKMRQTDGEFQPVMQDILKVHRTQNKQALTVLKEVLTSYVSNQLAAETRTLHQVEAALTELHTMDVKKLIDGFVPSLRLRHEASAAQLQPFVEACWQGTGSVNAQHFADLMTTKEWREVWVHLLNSRRTSGQFKLPAPGYASLCELLWTFLDKVQVSGDYSGVLSLAMLTHTFCLETEEGTEHVYLGVKQHQVWQEPQLWSQVLELAIDKELASFTQFAAEEDTASNRVKEIITAQLHAVHFLMEEFGVAPTLVRRTLQRHAQLYQVKDLTKA